MAKEWVVDDDGEGMWLKRTNKNRFIATTFDVQIFEKLPKFQLRQDDILLCSYAKTGTHWVWENLRMLMSGDILLDEVEKESMMMECFENMDHIPSPRILNNHALFEDQPEALIKGGHKVVFVYRNPKDVALSLYHHHSRRSTFGYNGTFNNFQKRFVEGKVIYNSYFDYLRSWEEGLKKHGNIPYLVVRYEDLHENPIKERRRLAKFIGQDYDDAFLQKVVDATSIDNMRQLKSENSLKNDDGVAFIYRKGKVGDWKDNFTVSESEWFDQVVEKEMSQLTMFLFTYDLE